MKKFLSILLALAVGFTFTFGSAMSAFATSDDVKADITSALNTANANLLTNYNSAKAGLPEYMTDGSNKIETAQLETILDAVYASYLAGNNEMAKRLISYAGTSGGKDGLVNVPYYVKAKKSDKGALNLDAEGLSDAAEALDANY